ncbi:MAG: type II secretion system protein GspN [Candidatus Dadabacteria bacterium]|nr:MAG: type II secretion system protein GspN [Candidatus Dadabacteria bacterium]
MTRFLIFAALLLAFVAWLFPHRLLVERVLIAPLRRHGIEVDIGRTRLSWPPGYELAPVRVRVGSLRLSLDSVRIGVGLARLRTIEVRACGGRVAVRLQRTPRSGPAARAEIEGIDPSSCIETGSLTLAGRFGAAIDARGLSWNQAAWPTGASASFRLDARDGHISGTLPAGSPGSGRPIGDWSFERLHAEGRAADHRLDIVRGVVRAQGLEWRADSVKIRIGASVASSQMEGSLLVRPLGNAPRAKAIMKLLPQASDTPGGWRHYRLAGTLASPRLFPVQAP